MPGACVRQIMVYVNHQTNGQTRIRHMQIDEADLIIFGASTGAEGKMYILK